MMSRKGRAREKVAIVTGGSGGIGKAIAKGLLEAGVRVIVVDRDDAGRSEAERAGAVFLQAELASAGECRRVVEEVSRQGGVDVLINNAGFQHLDAIEDFPEETWNEMLAVMLTAPFLLSRQCWPHMKRKRWGRIVNLASIHAQVASPFKAGYVSAKHGLLGLTRVLALEGGPLGITANAICPAYVRTPLVEGQIDSQARTRGIPPRQVVEEIMLGPAAVKRLIEPEEVGALVVYVCSEKGGSITGAALNIDLGWTAR